MGSENNLDTLTPIRIIARLNGWAVKMRVDPRTKVIPARHQSDLDVRLYLRVRSQKSIQSQRE